METAEDIGWAILLSVVSKVPKLMTLVEARNVSEVCPPAATKPENRPRWPNDDIPAPSKSDPSTRVFTRIMVQLPARAAALLAKGVNFLTIV